MGLSRTFAGSGSATTVEPSVHGFTGWVFDPALIAGSATLTAGVVYLSKIRVPAGTVTNLVFQTTANGTTLSNCYAALFNTSGTRLGVSADQTTPWTAAGTQTAALTTPYSAAAGYYYVAILCNGTTPPTFVRAGNTAGVNVGLTAGSHRFCTSGTSQTAMPAAITMGSAAAAAQAIWAAVS